MALDSGIPDRNDGSPTLVYNDERSGMGMPVPALQRNIAYLKSGQEGVPTWGMGTRKISQSQIKRRERGIWQR